MSRELVDVLFILALVAPPAAVLPGVLMFVIPQRFSHSNGRLAA